MSATPPNADSTGDSKSEVKSGLLAAFRQLLRPLIRILIRNGVAFGEFAEVAKTVYVESAAQDFRLPGRKPSGARIAILTGLTRKEVKRLSDKKDQILGGGTATLSRAGRVLAGWHSDSDFTGPYGIPLQLPFDSSNEPCFTELVRRYSGDMPARAMLEELVRVKAVDGSDETHLTVIERAYIPYQLDPEQLARVGITIHDLAATLDFNLDPRRKVPGRFERRVYTTEGIEEKDFPEFRELVEKKGQQLLVTLDDWLSSKEKSADQDETDVERIRTGVGIYLFQGDAEGGDPAGKNKEDK